MPKGEEHPNHDTSGQPALRDLFHIIDIEPHPCPDKVMVVKTVNEVAEVYSRGHLPHGTMLDWACSLDEATAAALLNLSICALLRTEHAIRASRIQRGD